MAKKYTKSHPLKVSSNVANLGRIAGQGQRAMRKALEDLVHRVVEYTIRNIADWPLIDTGTMMNSVKCREVSDGHWIVYVDYATAPYAVYQEFGTGERGKETAGQKYPQLVFTDDWPGIPARPFLGPAVDQGRKEIRAELTKALKKLR